MTPVLRLTTVLTLALAVASAAAAQSLGEVARKEEARRKAAKSGKTYTNDNVRGGSSSASVPATPAPDAAAKPTEPAKPAEPAKPEGADTKKDEAHWRGRISEARQGLERAKMFQEALQTRVNSLSNDFLSRDDPAQRSVISANRQKALAELDRVGKEIADYQKQIVAIEEEARKAGVPPGWLR